MLEVPVEHDVFAVAAEIRLLREKSIKEEKMPKTDTLDALDNAMTTILTTNKL